MGVGCNLSILARKLKSIRCLVETYPKYDALSANLELWTTNGQQYGHKDQSYDCHDCDKDGKENCAR